jgi:hypothetical protein
LTSKNNKNLLVFGNFGGNKEIKKGKVCRESSRSEGIFLTYSKLRTFDNLAPQSTGISLI